MNAVDLNQRSLSAHLKGLDEGPQERSNALASTQQLDQSHDPKEAEKRDGDSGAVLRALGMLGTK